MKKVLFLFLACLPLLFAACDEKEEEEIVFVEGNHTEHTFRLEGEALNKFNGINSDPALYGIEVLYADGTPYAYGLFDELSKAKVKLLNEQEFVFRTMIVRKGKEMCHSTSGNKYGDIFLLTNDGKAGTYCQLLNQFTYNRKTHFLHFRNPRQSFYFDAFTGYRPNLSDRTEKEIEIDTRTIAAKISISASGNNFGKIEFRLMSDVGEPVDRPFNEFSTPIFILTPEKKSLTFSYTLRDWGEDKETIPEEYELRVGESDRVYDRNGYLKGGFGFTDFTIKRRHVHTVGYGPYE